MQSIQNLARLALARLTERNPERLWIHYSIAISVILCLIVTAHGLNRFTIERGLSAAESIENSNQQVLLANEILHASEALADEPASSFAAFDKTIRRFETIHASLISSQIRSVALQNHYFGNDEATYRNIRQYIALAKQFSGSPQGERNDTVLQLQKLYSIGGLYDELLLAAALSADQAKEEAKDFVTLQQVVLAASILALLAETILIFLPAQLAVLATIRQMQRQTAALRNSRSQLKRMNGNLEHMVNHDQLTGLPNRGSLTRYLSLAFFQRRADELSLLFIGLDDFKSLNDLIGRDYGDALLISVSRALQSCVDSDNLVARVGGDEFVLISDEPTANMVPRVMSSLAEPFEIMGRRIPINASIGYLTVGNDENQPLDIVADAEVALHVAKSAGGGRAQAFTDDLRIDLELRHQLQLDLTDAIRNGEIEPWFQPQVRLSDGRLHGAEVLARWRHPTRGLLTPNLFLPAAERAGLMVELDHAVWRKAMELAYGWQDAHIWHPSISLNAAPDTIADPHLVERFLLMLQRSGLNTDQVIVEVLETTLIDGKDDMAAINIDSLAECGIALELDDFGTGYASLSKLTQLPLSGIKLDRSLVAPLPDPAADSVVRAILALASELGLHVIAEGVEEVAQAEHLKKSGCGVAQGYGYGRPMPPAEFAAWLSANANNALQAAAEIKGSAARA